MSCDHCELCGDGGGGVNAAYSQADGALQIVDVCPPSDVQDVLVDGPLAIGTFKYPGPSGFLNYGFTHMSLHGTVTTPAGCTVTIRVLAANDPSVTYSVNVTETALFQDGTTQNASVSVPQSSTVGVGMEIRDPAYATYIIEVVVAGATATNVSLWLYRKGHR